MLKDVFVEQFYIISSALLCTQYACSGILRFTNPIYADIWADWTEHDQPHSCYYHIDQFRVIQ